MCINDDGVWQLHGLSSKEGECLARPHPDVFASVSSVSDWIYNTIGSGLTTDPDII